MVRLEQDYYLTNFCLLVDFVYDKYGDLMSAKEHKIKKDWQNLSDNAQRLYVRLVTRRSEYFRLSKLVYPEILVSEAVQELLKSGFLAEFDHKDDLESFYQLWTKEELIQISRDATLPKGPSHWSKSDLVDHFVFYHSDELNDQFFGEKIIYPLHEDWVLTARLLFFGNLNQDLSEFILEDLGVLRFEKYEISKQERYFRKRSHVDHLRELIDYQFEFWLSQEERDVATVLRLLKSLWKIPLKDKLLERKRKNIAFKNTRFLENKIEDQKVLSFYKKIETPCAQERVARILFRQEKYKKALKICEILVLDERHKNEQEFAHSFQQKCLKKLGLPHEKVKREVFKTDIVCLKKADFKVEQLAVKYYEGQNLKALNFENDLWKAFFGLLFWDVIFAPMPGAFFHPFQRGPKDLRSSEFYSDRKELFEQRLTQFKTKTELREFLKSMFKEKKGVANYFVNWKKLKWSDLQVVMTCLTMDHLIKILHYMAYNPSERCKGLPDLFVYSPDKKKYELVEVKGPGDQLRSEQKWWLRFFNKIGVCCSVLRVEWKKY